MVKYFYVQLNENNIGAFIISSPRKLNASNMVLIPDYNETYIGRHWDGNQWSEERYDTEVEVELQQKVAELEATTEALRRQNDELVIKNNSLNRGINDIQEQNTIMEGMLMEIMQILAVMSAPTGGVE